MDAQTLKIECLKLAADKAPLRGDNQGERSASIRMRMRRGWADGGRA